MSLINTIKCDVPGCLTPRESVSVGHDFDGNITDVLLPVGWESLPDKDYDYDLSLDKHVCPAHTSRKSKAKARNG